MEPAPFSLSTQPQESYGLSKYKVKATHPDGALKVMVVEDNAELKIYIYNSLSAKYEVRDASNGKEALQLITDGWMPDIVVTDLMMPVMDGLETCRAIRSRPELKDVMVVFLSAVGNEETQRDFFRGWCL